MDNSLGDAEPVPLVCRHERAQQSRHGIKSEFFRHVFLVGFCERPPTEFKHCLNHVHDSFNFATTNFPGTLVEGIKKKTKIGQVTLLQATLPFISNNAGEKHGKAQSLNVPNKGLRKLSQTLLSTLSLTTANGFFSQTLPDNKSAAESHWGTSAKLEALLLLYVEHGLLSESSKENRTSIRDDGGRGDEERSGRVKVDQDTDGMID